MWSLNEADISYQEFLKNINDELIYEYYLGNFEDGSKFSAPWRNETIPSLKISYYNNKWVWIDYGEDNRPKSAIDFIKRYYNVDFQTALNKGYKDIIINNSNCVLSKKYTPKKVINTKHVIIQDISENELWYWNKAEISREILNKFKVFTGTIRHKGIIWHQSIVEDPLYIYMFDKFNEIYKGYRPLAKNQYSKFYASNISNHIQGYDLLPANGNILIITKSYKDVMVWYKLGYNAIAPHTENMFISPEIVTELKLRFNHIYINYDNDFTGITKSTEFAKMHNLNTLILPTNSNSKDPFEFVINHSYNELNNLIKSKIL